MLSIHSAVLVLQKHYLAKQILYETSVPSTSKFFSDALPSSHVYFLECHVDAKGTFSIETPLFLQAVLENGELTFAPIDVQATIQLHLAFPVTLLNDHEPSTGNYRLDNSAKISCIEIRPDDSGSLVNR